MRSWWNVPPLRPAQRALLARYLEWVLYKRSVTLHYIACSGVPSTSATRDDDLKCRPFRKKSFISVGKNVNQHAKISDNFFLVIYPQNKKFSFTELCHPLCRLLLTCTAPNFQLFSPYLPKMSHFLRKFDHFTLIFTFFPKCRPFRSAARATRPLWPPSVRHSLHDVIFSKLHACSLNAFTLIVAPPKIK